MEVLYRRCCGLDVHKETVVACLRLVSGGEVVREVRTFETTTASLIALSEWLAQKMCTHVAMEATGVYWKPVWHILADGDFELVLANASHVKNVPGRKTDVNDADWVADLLAHGLIRASFVPDTQTQELRTLLRTRKQLVREKASHILRMQKTLEDANIKLDSVITDVMGMSGRAMIEALIAARAIPPSWPAWPIIGEGLTGEACARLFAVGSPSTIASCFACISIRSMLSMHPSPRSTSKWRRALRPFGSQSSM